VSRRIFSILPILPILSFALLGGVGLATPAQAQTYAPGYPVCIHIYGGLVGDRIDCTYTSFEQCAATAAGLSATCLENPYFSGPVRGKAARSHHRHSRERNVRVNEFPFGEIGF